MSSETWAIVTATGLGPVLAVIISLWREAKAAKYNRRLYVFRTLMSTRKIAISAEHVNAINLVEVDFFKCKGVEAAWAVYKDHLNTGPEDDLWREKKENLLAKLLYEIGHVLKFDIPAIDIYKGGYAPLGWAYRDQQQMGVLEYLNQLSQGKNALPILPYNPAPQNSIPQQPSFQPVEAVKKATN